jgi:sugar/nucleoside kinase (ribokinase family)
VVGDVVTDVVARHEGPLAPDTDTAARIAVRPGGAGANVACWAAREGARVRLLGRVGADSAQWHRDALAAAGVEPVLRVDEQAPTAVVIALVDAAAERTLVTDSGAAFRLGPADWSPSLLDGVGRVHLSGYLCFSGPGRELATLVLAAARARGLPVSVDPASTGFLARLGVPRFLAVAEGAELLPNAAEALLLAGLPPHGDPGAAAEALSARAGGRPVVVTLGRQGALAAEGGTIRARADALGARAVDSTGAGDAFTGAFLAARLRDAPLADALAAGCRAGAVAVTRVGARPEIGS